MATNDFYIPEMPDPEGNFRTCPCCGNEGYDGTICDVCGYAEYPEGFGDIDIDKDKEEDKKEEKEAQHKGNYEVYTTQEVAPQQYEKQLYDTYDNEETAYDVAEELRTLHGLGAEVVKKGNKMKKVENKIKENSLKHKGDIFTDQEKIIFDELWINYSDLHWIDDRHLIFEYAPLQLDWEFTYLLPTNMGAPALQSEMIDDMIAEVYRGSNYEFWEYIIYNIYNGQRVKEGGFKNAADAVIAAEKTIEYNMMHETIITSNKSANYKKRNKMKKKQK